MRGVLRPRVVVSRDLLRAVDTESMATIVAHERAHSRRRDPLRRLLASLLLAFDLPPVATRRDAQLARAHEAAVDAEAAAAGGDPSAARFAARTFWRSSPRAEEGPPMDKLLTYAVIALVGLHLPGCTSLRRWGYEGWDRDRGQKPEEVIRALAIEPGSDVADVFDRGDGRDHDLPD